MFLASSLLSVTRGIISFTFESVIPTLPTAEWE